MPHGSGTAEARPLARHSSRAGWMRGRRSPFCRSRITAGDPGDQFFADGLTEETIANLARYKDLFVFSRLTTAKLAAEGADIRQLRETLGVDFVLESSVRRTEQLVRVTIQLIDGATEGHLLAERFERPCTPDGLFEIQDEIALLVAGRVADRYGPIGRYSRRARRTGRSERWETYLWTTRFFDYYAVHDPARHLEVREGLERALKDDPGSSDGWAALSIVLLDEYRFHFNERAGYPALDRALECALRAVTSDPENAFAYQALALAHFHKQRCHRFRDRRQSSGRAQSRAMPTSWPMSVSAMRSRVTGTVACPCSDARSS